MPGNVSLSNVYEARNIGGSAKQFFSLKAKQILLIYGRIHNSEGNESQTQNLVDGIIILYYGINKIKRELELIV